MNLVFITHLYPINVDNSSRHRQEGFKMTDHQTQFLLGYIRKSTIDELEGVPSPARQKSRLQPEPHPFNTVITKTSFCCRDEHFAPSAESRLMVIRCPG
jgi:hypothetical protein